MLSGVQAGDHLFLSLQELLPRAVMRGPYPVDPSRIRSSDDPFEYTGAFEIHFERPPLLFVHRAAKLTSLRRRSGAPR
jgi:hypothetical protein